MWNISRDENYISYVCEIALINNGHRNICENILKQCEMHDR